MTQHFSYKLLNFLPILKSQTESDRVLSSILVGCCSLPQWAPRRRKWMSYCMIVKPARRKQLESGRLDRLSEVNMKRGNAGFTLIETLIALTIFGIVSMAITSLMLMNTRMISENAQSSEAVGYAQELLENLREVSVDSLASGSMSSTRTSNRGTVYTVTWTVTPNTPASGRTLVAVTVAWNHKGSPRSYATQSIFTRISS